MFFVKEMLRLHESQGDMHLSELMSFLELVLERQNILGMDVCGECDMDSCSEDFLNDHANEAIFETVGENAKII